MSWRDWSMREPYYTDPTRYQQQNAPWFAVEFQDSSFCVLVATYDDTKITSFERYSIAVIPLENSNELA